MTTEMFTEYTEQNEKQLYAENSVVIKTEEEKIYGKAKRALRDTHAKSHAAVKAHIEIFDIDEDAIKQGLAERTNLPKTLIEGIKIKQGLFTSPGRYPVWLRFANGRPQVSSPLKKQDFGVLWYKCWNESRDVSVRFALCV